jgi:hypothetical protein
MNGHGDNESRDLPTIAMWRALLDYRARHGRTWKRALSVAWMTGADEAERFSGSLRMVRNLLGPSWFYDLRPADLDRAATAVAGYDMLPMMCATHLLSTGEPIVITRGEAGYRRLPEGRSIEAINLLFDVTPAHIAAMEAGSLFGWTVPGADPRSYDIAGKLIPSELRNA